MVSQARSLIKLRELRTFHQASCSRLCGFKSSHLHKVPSGCWAHARCLVGAQGSRVRLSLALSHRLLGLRQRLAEEMSGVPTGRCEQTWPSPQGRGVGAERCGDTEHTHTHAPRDKLWGPAVARGQSGSPVLSHATDATPAWKACRFNLRSIMTTTVSLCWPQCLRSATTAPFPFSVSSKAWSWQRNTEWFFFQSEICIPEPLPELSGLGCVMLAATVAPLGPGSRTA